MRLVILLIFSFGFNLLSLFGQQVALQNWPAKLQLFPRDAQDSAVVRISGDVLESGFTEVKLEIYKQSQLWKERTQTLAYQNGKAAFDFSPKIHAEASEYDFHLLIDTELVARRDSILCGDVYLINGQSNSHPNAVSYSFSSEFCRSFGRHTGYTDYDPADTTWGLSTGQGWCEDCNYAVGVWGLRLQEMILSKYGMPTCLINGGSGGSSISYNLPDSADHLDLTTTYGRLLYRATKAKVEAHVKALLWHQGESDSGSPDAEAYTERFTELRDAWRTDYAPLDKIYVFQIHPGNCGGAQQDYFRNEQRNFKGLFPDVSVMATNGLIGHDGCHYNDDGYLQMASWIFPLMERDFYSRADTVDIDAPDLLNAHYANQSHTQIALEFDQPVIWPDDSLNASMKDYFYLDGESGFVQNGYTINDDYTVILQLTSAREVSLVTYLPSFSYNHAPLHIYQGPWIRNSRGIGALSFFEAAVGDAPSAIATEGTKLSGWRLYQNYPNPFNPSTTIRYQIPGSRFVTINIYNNLGQKVVTLVSGQKSAGMHEVEWDTGSFTSGVYYCRLETAQGQVLTQKLILLK